MFIHIIPQVQCILLYLRFSRSLCYFILISSIVKNTKELLLCQAAEEKQDMDALQESNRRILFNLLPAHVATHFLDNQFRNNMVSIWPASKSIHIRLLTALLSEESCYKAFSVTLLVKSESQLYNFLYTSMLTIIRENIRELLLKCRVIFPCIEIFITLSVDCITQTVERKVHIPHRPAGSVPPKLQSCGCCLCLNPKLP